MADTAPPQYGQLPGAFSVPSTFSSLEHKKNKGEEEEEEKKHMSVLVCKFLCFREWGGFFLALCRFTSVGGGVLVYYIYACINNICKR